MDEFDSQSTGSYTRICELAKGGMGTVDLAVRREGAFQRLYAMKRLRETYREDPEFRTMFLDEARIAGFIRHPHVVSVLDIGEDDEGPFLILDYVDGPSAAALIRRASELGRIIPLSVGLRIAIDSAEGLHAAHELRDPQTGDALELVHRDVSPQNILLGYDGAVRVTDFGVAKALGRVTRTHTGVLKGKMGYMPPEVLRFEEPDRRSDLFSLGVVLFELLIGRRLYKNQDGMDGARRVLNEPPPDLGELRQDAPADLVELMFQLLAKDPAHRPETARAVARRLETILAEVNAEQPDIELSDYLAELFEQERKNDAERIRAALEQAKTLTTQAQPRVAPPRRRRRILTAIVLAGFLASAVVLALALTGETPPPAPDPSLGQLPIMEFGEVTIESVPPGESEMAPESTTTEPVPAKMRRASMAKMRENGTPMWGWQ